MAIDLWQIRRQKRMTIDELARRAEIHPGLIKAYELGERAIYESDRTRLADALEVEPEEIKELSDPPPRGPSRQSPPPSQGYDSGSSRYDSFNRYESGAGYTRPGDYSARSSYGSDQRPSYGNDFDRNTGYSPRHSGDYQPQRSGPRPANRGRIEKPPKKPGGPKRRPQVAPARQSQLDHLKTLLVRLEMSGDELLRLAGKPLSMLNRKEAAELLTTCQNMLAERKPEKPKGKRQRPYLPESVDEHELLYLTRLQLEKRPMQLTLFNGDSLGGTLLGFSPYALTLADGDGREVTVQKLAIAYYEAPLSQPANESEPAS
jgi:transcriptional regulator with XRE-family HTH domain